MNEKRVTQSNSHLFITADFIQFLSRVDREGSIYWRFDIDKKKVYFLNDHPIAGLRGGDELENLLQNLVWAQEVVLEEDFLRFKMFIKALRERKETSVIFRLARINDQSGHPWLKISGVPAEENSTDYYGYIRDISADVDFINQLQEKDLERQTMIETEDIPVLLVDMKTREIISRNTFAYDLLEYSYHDFNTIKFQDLVAREWTSMISEIYEACLLEGLWEGSLPLVKKGGEVIRSAVKISRLSLRERNLLKISVQKIIPLPGSGLLNRGSSLPDREQFQQELLTAVIGKTDIKEILAVFLLHQFIERLFDAIIYVDVHLKKREVDFYAYGNAFSGLKVYNAYDSDSIISQALREGQIEYFAREDTLASTKPLDWALFIPHGIRSYYVKPFFHGSVLNTLLIFCSTSPGWYEQDICQNLEVYYPVFMKALKKRRKVLKSIPG